MVGVVALGIVVPGTFAGAFGMAAGVSGGEVVIGAVEIAAPAGGDGAEADGESVPASCGPGAPAAGGIGEENISFAICEITSVSDIGSKSGNDGPPGKRAAASAIPGVEAAAAVGKFGVSFVRGSCVVSGA
ncbi:MAG: hypothetical protein ACRELY_19655 [Polyangiaceae bacterium]